jgi:hypothetical protein
MGIAQIWEIKFQVVKPGAAGSNSAYQYRREQRSTRVLAASPAAALAVLNANVTGLVAGEVIEVVSIQEESFGTEVVNGILT